MREEATRVSQLQAEALTRSRIEVELEHSRLLREEAIKRSRVGADLQAEAAVRRSRVEAQIEVDYWRRYYRY